ncbi:hypothetical protein [Nostoc sp. 'Peltigera membranacea cyanobiont' 232]|uniref:hypothetical protein n=1 Tax=Nostoc sp. 'Peltigera membranacea cyanobiont' 232 TaxID=2014531 RepID=UPI000B95AD44|nr:hypothetical protein [Nostoc sp. 'Peltigera membranacea cyanobiont' 232]OYE01621.1 hypothetical protein CDG79_28585 [Nostoc sp. 'Peltigera membranacea cyanobiont' 232]
MWVQTTINEKEWSAMTEINVKTAIDTWIDEGIEPNGTKKSSKLYRISATDFKAINSKPKSFSQRVIANQAYVVQSKISYLFHK